MEERDPAHHQVGEWGDPSLVEECDLLEMGICSSEMEMSKMSIIIKTGFRPL